VPREVIDIEQWVTRPSHGAHALYTAMTGFPGAWLSVETAAAAGGITPGAARRQLAELLGAGLVRESASDRYTTPGSGQSRMSKAALERTTAWYVQAGTTALASMGMDTSYFPLVSHPQITAPTRPSGFAAGRDWLDEHHEQMAALVESAFEAGARLSVWQLAWVISVWCRLHNFAQEWTTTSRLGLRAAESLGDLTGQGAMYESIGKACLKQGMSIRAAGYLQRAFDLRAAAGDRPGLLRSHNALGLVAQREKRWDDALGHFEIAKALATDLGDQLFIMITVYNEVNARGQAGARYAVRGLHLHG
jgi:tetratricopeptide (TPR) repeat protein